MTRCIRLKKAVRINGAWLNLRLSILEPKKAIWQGMAKEVKLPSPDGEICVLDFHQSFVVRLAKGNIVFDASRIAIKDGVAYMRSNSLTVFAQT